MAARTHFVSERQGGVRQQHDIAKDRRERTSAAVEQLHADSALRQQMGLQLIEELMDEFPRSRQEHIDLLCAFLRAQGTPAQSEHPAGATARAVITFLRDKLSYPSDLHWLDLSIDLSGATVYDLDLTSCLLRTGRFVETTFEGATSFMLTEFSAGLDLTGARFNGQANFTMADINGSMECTRVTFATGAAFDDVRVRTAVFDGTVFMADADLRFADMTAAASFAGTEFRGNFTLAARRPRTFVNLAGISVRGTLDISAPHGPTLTTVEGARVTQPELAHRCTPDLTIDDRNGCLLLTTDRQPVVVLGRQRHDDGERPGDPRPR